MSSPLPVYALHAGGLGPGLWAPVMAAAGELRLEIPDLNVEAAALPQSAHYGELVACLVARAPHEPFVLAGATIGARLALSVAAELGDRVRGLYLLTPTPVDEDESFLATLAGLRRFMVEGLGVEGRQALIPTMVYRWGCRFPAAAAELDRLLEEGARYGLALARICSELGDPPSRLLERIEAPIEVLFGAEDPILQRSWVDSWRNQPPVRRVELLSHASHQIALDRPEVVAADLRRLAGG